MYDVVLHTCSSTVLVAQVFIINIMVREERSRQHKT